MGLESWRQAVSVRLLCDSLKVFNSYRILSWSAEMDCQNMFCKMGFMKNASSENLSHMVMLAIAQCKIKSFFTEIKIKDDNQMDFNAKF